MALRRVGTAIGSNVGAQSAELFTRSSSCGPSGHATVQLPSVLLPLDPLRVAYSESLPRRDQPLHRDRSLPNRPSSHPQAHLQRQRAVLPIDLPSALLASCIRQSACRTSSEACYALRELFGGLYQLSPIDSSLVCTFVLRICTGSYHGLHVQSLQPITVPHVGPARRGLRLMVGQNPRKMTAGQLARYRARDPNKGGLLVRLQRVDELHSDSQRRIDRLVRAAVAVWALWTARSPRPRSLH